MKNPALTKAEGKVLLALAETALADKEIAYALGVTMSAIRAHKSSLFKKMGVGSRQELMLGLRRRG